MPKHTWDWSVHTLLHSYLHRVLLHSMIWRHINTVRTSYDLHVEVIKSVVRMYVCSKSQLEARINKAEFRERIYRHFDLDIRIRVAIKAEEMNNMKKRPKTTHRVETSR